MQDEHWYLTAEEKAELHVLADNDVATRAIKKLLLQSAYYQGTLVAGKEATPTLNFALQLVAGAAHKDSNEKIGENLRARWEGVNYVEAGFQDLGKFKTQVSPEKKKGNPAR